MQRIVALVTGSMVVFLSFCANNNTEKRESLLHQREQTTKPPVSIASVYDNYGVKPQLKTAWGFSSVIATPSDNILFDSGGNAEILLGNMQKMNIDPSSIDKVFISHIHADHLGGLEGFLEINSAVTVFIPASFPDEVRNMIRARGATFVDVSAPQNISGIFFSTGEMEGPPTEQSLIIDTSEGLVVMTGCAHPGIVEIVKKAGELIHGADVFLVVGGFHHPSSRVVKAFREFGVKKAAPSHCSGDAVREAFKKEYREDFIEYGTGQIIEIK